VLAVSNEAQLQQLADKLTRFGVPHVEIREPDPPYYNQLMTLGLPPTRDRSGLRRFLGKLPLLGTSTEGVAP
jgi:hypothetical protein